MCPKRPYRRYAPLPPLRRGKLICRKPKASPAKAGEGNRAAVVGATHNIALYRAHSDCGIASTDIAFSTVS